MTQAPPSTSAASTTATAGPIRRRSVWAKATRRNTAITTNSSTTPISGAACARSASVSGDDTAISSGAIREACTSVGPTAKDTAAHAVLSNVACRITPNTTTASATKYNRGEKLRIYRWITEISSVSKSEITRMDPYARLVTKLCTAPKLKVASTNVIRYRFNAPKADPNTPPRPPAKDAPPSTSAVTAISV